MKLTKENASKIKVGDYIIMKSDIGTREGRVYCNNNLMIGLDCPDETWHCLSKTEKCDGTVEVTWPKKHPRMLPDGHGHYKLVKKM